MAISPLERKVLTYRFLTFAYEFKISELWKQGNTLKDGAFGVRCCPIQKIYLYG